jgi:taurine transport system substrate-binding protein
MKKILSFILSSIVALNLSISVANSAANEVRVAFFLEWPTPNQEDKVKGMYEKALGVPVKWTNFTNGGAMTDAMLAGDIDISYSQGLVPFINAVKSKAPIKLVDIAMEYGMGGTTCVTSNASGITKANASELEGKKVAVPLGTMAEYVFDESMKACWC